MVGILAIMRCALITRCRSSSMSVGVVVEGDSAPTAPHMIAIGCASRRNPEKNRSNCSCSIVW
jgi:hypothetical protein